MTPVIYWSIAWAFGIWLSSRLTIPSLGWAGGGLAALLVITLTRSAKPRLALTYALALALGAARYTIHDSQFAGSLAGYNDQGEVTLVGVVADEPDVRGNFVFYKLDAKSLVLQDSGARLDVEGAARVRGPRYPVYDYGDLLQVDGSLQEPPVLDAFDYRDYLAQKGIHSQVPFAEVQRLSSGDGSAWKRSMLALKGRAQATIGRILPEPEASLLNGVLLGNEGGIAADLKDDFKATGTSHVIAISGFNISILSGLIIAGVTRLIADRRKAAGVAILGVVGYTILVGADAAVVRAAIMGSVALFGLMVNRTGLALNTLAVAVLIMTALNPYVLWDVGFQLSVAATLGLILYAERLDAVVRRLMVRRFSEEWADRIVNWISEALLLTLAAQVWTMPLILWHFGQLSVVSLLTNALILPFQPAVMGLGGLATLAGLLFEPLGQMLGWAAYLPLTWTIRVVERTARFPSASIPLGLSDGGVVAIYGFLIAATVLALMDSERRRALWEQMRTSVPAAAGIGLGGMTLAAVIGWLVIFQLPDRKLHVTFLDVGQGDAIFIETPGGAQILVDGGPAGNVLLAGLGRHLPFWDHTLDLIVSTHPDADHLTGLIAALERYDVGAVLAREPIGESQLHAVWKTALASEDTTLIRGDAGARLELSDGVAFEVLYPGPTPVTTGKDNTNDDSIVLRLSYRDVVFLLPGDIEGQVENELVRSGAYLSSTVLKVPHHGSDTSSSQALLEAVRPQVAVISVGAENAFGHPSQEVLERLRDILVYRTDLHGSVSITSDGHQVWIETER